MVVALIAFLVGALLLWLGWRNRRNVNASMSWPHVAGRVVSATVSESHNRGDDDTPDSTSYTPVVEYEYMVGQQIYRGNRLAFQDKSYPNWKQASAVLQSFPAGGPIWVFHDPHNPANCVLDRTAHSNNFILIVGIILVAVAVAAAIKG
jgi:hypothetical protein